MKTQKNTSIQKNHTLAWLKSFVLFLTTLFPEAVRFALRKTGREKTYSFLNISGLSLGLAAGFLILFFVMFEKSYDSHYKHTENIYRLTYYRASNDGTFVHFASCAPPAGPAIRDTFPEVDILARMAQRKAIIKKGPEKFLENNIYYADTQLPDMFQIPFVKGTGDLNKPYTAIISESIAQKYFGQENPVGKTLTVDDHEDYLIMGVFRDVPPNSHFTFNILLSYPTFLQLRGDDYHKAWGHTGVYTYVRLKQGTDMQQFQNKLDHLVISSFGEVLKAYNLAMALIPQNIRDIHLDSHLLQEFKENSSRDIVNFLEIIAFFIIFVAWMNTVNLSTARAMTRSKEMGLRKTLGASRTQLVFQIISESLITHLLSLAGAILLIQVLFPFLTYLTGIPQSISIWSTDNFIILMTLIVFSGILLSSAYPAFILSSANPLSSLKPELKGVRGSESVRKGLVFFQMFIAFFLIAGTLTVTKQLIFMEQKNTGVNIHNRIAIQAPIVRPKNLDETSITFVKELTTIPGVNDAAFISEVPGRQIYWDAGGIFREGQSEDKGKNYMIVGLDQNAITFFNLQLIYGRNFSGKPSDNKSLIINETAVKQLGYSSPEQALNTEINYWGTLYTVIGILKDYHHQSVKVNPEPTLFRYMNSGRGYFICHLPKHDNLGILKKIETLYLNQFPGNTFSWFPVELYYREQFQTDRTFGQIFGTFSLLALCITALGIFGLSLYTIARKTKEIGIKKVLGASTFSIFRGLITQYLVLAVSASLCSAPLVYYAISIWLKQFAVRIELKNELFISPLIILVCVTFISVAFQTWRSTAKSAVEALRYE